MTTLPGIIMQRWAAACESPSLRQWHSIYVWLTEFADIAAAHPETAHWSEALREKAAEARRNMREMMQEVAV